MKLTIESFSDAGDLKKERVILRAASDVDIGGYLVLRSKNSVGGGPVSGSKNAYWFPDTKVGAGDLVVLYTRSGIPGRKSLGNGRTAHFYYWHKKVPFWSKEKDNVAVLVETKDWGWNVPD